MANSMAVPLPPELLLAAKRGDWRKLDDAMSMSNGGALLVPVPPPPPQVTVDIDIEEADDVQYGSDSVLHVVASSSSWSSGGDGGGGGEGEPLIMSSTVICNKAQHLLGARNARGDTPLHCAARAGNIKMVSHLMDLLARRRHDDGGGCGGGGDDASMLQAVLVVLRMENKRGETALHDAIRRGDGDMVRLLMSADAELARFPRKRNGVSPLYLAILLGHDDIAEQLYQKDNQLSYSGPDGQNAMHVAVVRSERMTTNLIEWNRSLIKQGDRSSGSTPLHSAAASWGTSKTSGSAAKLLLDAYEPSAYQSDDKGSFPIHVAALRYNRVVVGELLKKCPDCAQLQDAEGRTLLHVAALKGHYGLVRWTIFSFLRGNPKDLCDVQRFASTMNMQDNQGNTALHYAAKSRSYRTLYPFIWFREVQLNLQNNEGKTALDLARMTTPQGLLFVLDPEVRILSLLRAAGARPGFRPRGDEEDEDAKLNEEKEAEKIKDSTATIGIASVLCMTISFAVAFQFPGGYSTGDNKQPAGTPELAKVYSFEAFVVANNLAAFCSTVATLSIMIAGVTTVGLRMRKTAFIISIFFLNGSARSLAAAFAFGTYAMLAPVARAAPILTWVLTSLLVVDIAWFTWMHIQDMCILRNRLGCTAVCLGVAYFSVVIVLLASLWPYVVIVFFLAYMKAFRIH